MERVKIFTKRNGSLVENFDGYSVKKNMVKLKEDIEASIGQANGVRQAIQKASKLTNQNSNVAQASTNFSNIDNQDDSKQGEGIEVKIPSNANGDTIAKTERMVKSQDMDDAKLTVTKPNNVSNLGESVTFSKKEMRDFLRSI